MQKDKPNTSVKIKEHEEKIKQMEKKMSHLRVENAILKATVSLAEERGYLKKNDTAKK